MDHISPGRESEGLSNMLLTRNSTCHHDQLCRLDIIGIEDQPSGEQEFVYKEFKDELQRHPQGFYETSLIWKVGHPNLDNNKAGSLLRLKNLLGKLKKGPEKLEQHDNIIKEQLAEGIIERVTIQPNGKEYYIPHKPVIREKAESTKMRIAYDVSAKFNCSSPSLNKCLETGPALQNLLWCVLVRNRFFPVALCGHIKQAFLQVRIKKEDRDALRFHWIKDTDPKQIDTLQFILGGTLDAHLESKKGDKIKEIAEIKKSLPVDDFISGEINTTVVKRLKQLIINIFGEEQFILHKWHSNVPELEDDNNSEEIQTYAKAQLGVERNETKILGLT